QKRSISGMNGKPSTHPDASSDARISSRLRISTTSPARNRDPTGTDTRRIQSSIARRPERRAERCCYVKHGPHRQAATSRTLSTTVERKTCTTDSARLWACRHPSARRPVRLAFSYHFFASSLAMRILFVNLLPSPPPLVGGVATSPVQLRTRLEASGHAVAVLCTLRREGAVGFLNALTRRLTGRGFPSDRF